MADKGLSEVFVNKYAEKCPVRDVDTMIWLKINLPELVKTAKLQTLEDVWKVMKVECMANQGVYVTSIKGIVQDRKHGCDNLDTENSPECTSAVCPLIKNLREAL